MEAANPWVEAAEAEAAKIFGSGSDKKFAASASLASIPTKKIFRKIFDFFGHF